MPAASVARRSSLKDHDAGPAIATSPALSGVATPAIGVRSYRTVALVWSIVFFGALASMTIWKQASRLLEWD